MEEIAQVAECHVDTLRDRFSNIIKKGQADGKSSLRRRQFKVSESNVSMAIWLGKQWLGQKDKLESEDAITEAQNSFNSVLKNMETIHELEIKHLRDELNAKTAKKKES